MEKKYTVWCFIYLIFGVVSLQSSSNGLYFQLAVQQNEESVLASRSSKWEAEFGESSKLLQSGSKFSPVSI